MNIKSKLPKAKNNTWAEIRKNLSKCSSSDLLGLVSDLYALSKANKDFLDARFLKDRQALERYKAQIKRYLAPSEPWKESQPIRLREAKKVISDYKKALNDPIDMIELMVYYVECGTDFLCEFGDMYEQYYISLESVFEKVLHLMKQQDESEISAFIFRLCTVVTKANDMGWGYYDTISDLLDEAYPSAFNKAARSTFK